MVEMLGVLAIVGILAITGILGYRFAMTKHQTNEMSNQLNLMSNVLKMQYNQHNNPDALTLDGLEGPIFKTYPIQGFGVDETQKILYITVQNIPKQLCKSLYTAMIDSISFLIDIEHIETQDLDMCGDDNTMTFYFDATENMKEETENLCQNVSCGECQRCILGNCHNKNSGEICSAGVCLNGYCATDEIPTDGCEKDENCGKCQVCNEWHRCIMKNDIETCGSCESATDCGPDEFCEDTNASAGERHYKQCVGLRFSRILGGDGRAYLVSKNKMSWWDADTACKKMGMQLIPVESLVIPENIRPGNRNYDAGLQSYTDGMYEQIGIEYVRVWSGTEYGASGAYMIGLYSGNVDFNYKNGRDYYALCRPK